MSLPSSSLNEWPGFARELADEARAILGPAAALRPDVQVKADKNFVTALDALRAATA